MSETTLVTFNNYLTHENTQNYLRQVLGKKKESFVTNCVSLVSNNVNLQNCVPATIMYSAIKATSLGLPLDNNLGFAYVLPYNNTKKGVIEAQFQLGYKGFIQLAMRSGQFQTINATDVRDGEIKKVDRLTGEIDFEWIEKDRDSKAIIGYVAFFRLSNGFTKSHYMTIKELEKHGQKYSKSYATQFSNWKNMFEAMATKTVIKLLLSKYAPLSIEMKEAAKYDQSVIRDENEFQYIDNDKTIDIDAISEEEEFARVRKFISESKTKTELKEIQDSLSEDLLLIFLPEIDEKYESLKK